MGISKEELRAIFEKEFCSEDLNPDDIPHIELYIDQITTLFDRALSDRKRHEDEKILTKTMVNNYSKEGILRPIKSKKYSREHIIQMAMIYMMKQSLSIQDIRSIFGSGCFEDDRCFERIYRRYGEMKQKQIITISQFFEQLNDSVQSESDEELLALILCLCGISSTVVRSVEALIDRHFASLSTDSKEKGKKN